MKVTEQTLQQLRRFLGKIAQKFPNAKDISILTDIHLRVSQDSGALVAFNDDEEEITRCVVEEWIDNKSDNFEQEITSILRNELISMSKVIDNLGILKPYSFVLENEDKEEIAELYLADDDTVIIGGDIMVDLNKDLDSFFSKLMQDQK